ncbi:hypothetical protein RI367_004254 [Sorochytrium milnesiophthora]
MTRTNETHTPHATQRDRHVARNGAPNHVVPKKGGAGVGGWGRPGDEVSELGSGEDHGALELDSEELAHTHRQSEPRLTTMDEQTFNRIKQLQQQQQQSQNNDNDEEEEEESDETAQQPQTSSSDKTKSE